MYGYTADQLAALASRYQSCLAVVELPHSTPLRYCTGDRPVAYSGDVYEPRGMVIDSMVLDDPQRSRMAVSLDDLDGELRAVWYANRMARNSYAWSANTITVALEVNEATVIEIPWRCRACRVDRRGRFRIELLGISTLKPRAGLQAGHRSEFFAAPEPGLQIRYSGGGFTMPEGNDWPPAGGGGTGGGGGGGTTGGGGQQQALPPDPPPIANS